MDRHFCRPGLANSRGSDQTVHCAVYSSAVSLFCLLQITFSNSLDTDQAEQNVGPDLDPNCSKLKISF